ncbi:MAG TPA: Flp family type IVb pilin [Geminicoccaceae bacterium]
MQRLLTVLEPRLRAIAIPATAIAACRRGATAIEYGLIAALVALALVGVLEMLRDSLIGLPMNQITSAIASVLS